MDDSGCPYRFCRLLGGGQPDLRRPSLAYPGCSQMRNVTFRRLRRTKERRAKREEAATTFQDWTPATDRAIRKSRFNPSPRSEGSDHSLVVCEPPPLPPPPKATAGMPCERG